MGSCPSITAELPAFDPYFGLPIGILSEALMLLSFSASPVLFAASVSFLATSFVQIPWPSSAILLLVEVIVWRKSSTRDLASRKMMGSSGEYHEVHFIEPRGSFQGAIFSGVLN